MAAFGEGTLAVGHGAPAGSLRFAASGNHACGVGGIVENSCLRVVLRGTGLRGCRPAGGGFGRCAPVSSRGGAGGGHGLVRAGDSGELGGQACDAFATVVVFDGDRLAGFDALRGARPRLFGDDPRDELFAQVGAQVRQGTRVLGRDEDPHRDGVLVGVGDLDAPGASVPQVGGVQEVLDLGADQAHRGGPVKLEFDCPQLGGGAARPVLEGRGGEVAARDDEASLVPDAHHDVGQGDLLDGAGFLLVAGDDDIADADRISEGQLEAGEDVAEGLLCREADDDGQEAGGGEEGGHRLAGRLEGADDGDDANADDDGLGQPAKDLCLRFEAARTPLVGGLAGLCGVLEDPGGRVRHPGQEGQTDDEEDMHEEGGDRGALPVGEAGVDQGDPLAHPGSPGGEGEVGGLVYPSQDRRGGG